MRFGIKTAPQHTSWGDMLDVWRAADEVELFETAWNFDHFYPLQGDKNGPCLEAWVTSIDRLFSLQDSSQRFVSVSYTHLTLPTNREV